jgi:hypothetical protein
MSDPREFGSPLRGAAIQMNELFNELRRAGFSRKEALYLVSQLITGAVSSSIEQRDDNDNPDLN